MSEELKAIDFLRAKTITYELSSEELHYSLILYNLIMNLQRENEELKLQQKGTTHCYDEEEHKRLQEENQELKKQLEDYKKWYQDELEENVELSDLWINRRARVIELENQQKEFIEYLEDCINKTDYEVNVLGNYKYLAWANAYKNALTKYKEIIGVKDE